MPQPAPDERTILLLCVHLTAIRKTPAWLWEIGQPCCWASVARPTPGIPAAVVVRRPEKLWQVTYPLGGVGPWTGQRLNVREEGSACSVGAGPAAPLSLPVEASMLQESTTCLHSPATQVLACGPQRISQSDAHQRGAHSYTAPQPAQA
jgi:hypothetical protein